MLWVILGCRVNQKKIWSFCGFGVGVVSPVQRHQDLQRERGKKTRTLTNIFYFRDFADSRQFRFVEIRIASTLSMYVKKILINTCVFSFSTIQDLRRAYEGARLQKALISLMSIALIFII